MSAHGQKELWFMRRLMAVLVASIFTTIAMTGYVFLTKPPKHNGIGGFLIGLVASWPTVLVWVTISFLIVGVPILLFFKWRRITNCFAFAMAGAVVGFLSWIIPWGIIEWEMKKSPKPSLMEVILTSDSTYLFMISGFCCGIIYWFIVHRRPLTVFK